MGQYILNPEINMMSKTILIKAWQTEYDTDKPWKTKTAPWKELIPGDTIKIEFNFNIDRWYSKYQPEFKVYAYRNDELLFETTNTPQYIANFLKHYIFEEK